MIIIQMIIQGKTGQALKAVQIVWQILILSNDNPTVDSGYGPMAAANPMVSGMGGF